MTVPPFRDVLSWFNAQRWWLLLMLSAVGTGAASWWQLTQQLEAHGRDIVTVKNDIERARREDAEAWSNYRQDARDWRKEVTTTNNDIMKMLININRDLGRALGALDTRPFRDRAWVMPPAPATPELAGERN